MPPSAICGSSIAPTIVTISSAHTSMPGTLYCPVVGIAQCVERAVPIGHR